VSGIIRFVQMAVFMITNTSVSTDSCITEGKH
jgi:hypothetical protein